MTRIQALLLFVATPAAAMSALGAFSRAVPAPWLINETPSLPRGLYVRTPEAPARGAIVAVAAPVSARTYISSLHAPTEARLLKRVVAGPGETVCRAGAQVTWGRSVAFARAKDRRGRPLPAWQGCRRLNADEILVMGDSPASFDSRYFGPVRRGAVEGVYREAWRW